MPLLIEPMQRLELPTLFDTPLPTQGHGTGRSLGGVRTIWLRAMVSRGDHRLVPVAPWGAKRLGTLGSTPGQAVPRVACTADRLDMVLRRWRADTRWAACEAALQPHPVRVSDLSTAQGPVERTSARGDATVSAGGRCQCGHRQEARPDLPQSTGMPAV
jgi:hypothetical protein